MENHHNSKMANDKERHGVETESGCIVFDVPEEKGIELIVPVAGCMRASVFMDDEEAQNFVNIIQNKLNGRL